jgi:hypothetical protein
MSIAPLMDPFGSVLCVVGATSATTEVAEAPENIGSQDLVSVSAEQARMRIAKAINDRLFLDLDCIFLHMYFSLPVSLKFERSNAMGYTCKIWSDEVLRRLSTH